MVACDRDERDDEGQDEDQEHDPADDGAHVHGSPLLAVATAVTLACLEFRLLDPPGTRQPDGKDCCVTRSGVGL